MGSSNCRSVLSNRGVCLSNRGVDLGNLGLDVIDRFESREGELVDLSSSEPVGGRDLSQDLSLPDSPARTHDNKSSIQTRTDKGHNGDHLTVKNLIRHGGGGERIGGDAEVKAGGGGDAGLLL